jgi:hypothetical protein
MARAAMSVGSHVMLDARWMLLLLICGLLSAHCFADEADDAASDPAPDTSLAVEAAHADLAYASLWQLRYPLELTISADDWQSSIADLEFKNGGVFERLSELHHLSFLTVAEIGQGRLFLGVNGDGLVGIHYRAFSRRNDEQYLEMIRMPYLKDKESSSSFDQPEPQ